MRRQTRRAKQKDIDEANYPYSTLMVFVSHVRIFNHGLRVGPGHITHTEHLMDYGRYTADRELLRTVDLYLRQVALRQPGAM
jgi:hypothetical protein